MHIIFRRHFMKNRVSYMLILFSSILFIAFYGYRVLNFTYTDWLMSGGDLSQHYLGWKLFRISPWQPMIGMMNSSAYPFSQSIIFTDSIPLFAIFFKALSPILPTSFQYFGLYGFISFLLQGLLASFILKRYLQKDMEIFLGSILFLLVPAFLRRIFWHTSLCSHWLILLALLLFVYRDSKDFSFWKKLLSWSLVGMLCASIHLYFLPMCGLVVAVSSLSDFMKDRRLVRALAPTLCFCVCAFFSIWLLGGFSSGMYDGAPGLGYYSFNLIGFVNPENWSSIFSELSYYADGQYEGFAYLGIGVILLIITSAFYFIRHLMKDRPSFFSNLKHHSDSIFAILIFLFSIFMAASNEITFGRLLLLKIPIPEFLISIWSFFRSSGRLVWPSIYLIMIYAICLTARYAKRRTMTILLLFCVLLQAYELHDILMEKHTEFNTEASYTSLLTDPLWSALTKKPDLTHIVFTDKDNLTQEELYAFADYSSDHNMTINDFYFARALASPVKEVSKDFLLHADNSCIYIFTPFSSLNCLNYSLHYYEADRFIIGLKTPISGLKECSVDQLKIWSYKFAGSNLINGEDINGIRHLKDGGISYGPFISVPAGSYHVSILGKGLERAYYECYSGGGSLSYPPDNLILSDNLVTFYFHTPAAVEDLELKILNGSSSEITIRKILLEYQ